MGLDNIWRVPEGTEHPKMRVSLCGGMFSGPEGGACTSFRGKVYSDFIESVSGISLYQDSIAGDEITIILESLVIFKDRLESIPPSYRRLKFIRETLGDISTQDLDWGLSSLKDLITMFSEYENIEGAELVSWY